MISSECKAQIRTIIPPAFHVYEPRYLPWQSGPGGQRGRIPLDAFPTNYPGRKAQPKNCVCVCLSVCAAMCLSNPHLPRQFQDHHSDRFNDQWQSGLQLRAGISVLSQPIRAEMLGNWKGQAEPYESACAHTHTHTHTHTHRPTKLSHIYIYYN